MLNSTRRHEQIKRPFICPVGYEAEQKINEKTGNPLMVCVYRPSPGNYAYPSREEPPMYDSFEGKAPLAPFDTFDDRDFFRMI